MAKRQIYQQKNLIEVKQVVLVFICQISIILMFNFFFPDAVVDDEPTKSLPTDPVKLQQLRDHIGMELLWTEQAIQSRKKVRNARI